MRIVQSNPNVHSKLQFVSVSTKLTKGTYKLLLLRSDMMDAIRCGHTVQGHNSRGSAQRHQHMYGTLTALQFLPQFMGLLLLELREVNDTSANKKGAM